MTATVADRVVTNGSEAGAADASEPAVKVTRRRIDTILIWLGVATTAVLVIAGALLQWGNSFAEDYVRDELSAQNITFPDADSLTGQGRDDLVQYADQQVTTGEHAEAYASYIGGHIEGIAEGQTYAELGGPERAAEAAVADAIESGAPAAEVEALEAEAAELSAQRESIFRGEMLRGALLNTYAWSVIGRIAGIAAVVAFAASAIMFLLVAAGVFHVRRAAR